MTLNIEQIGRDYVYKRFPYASVREKEKIVNDWKNKLEASQELVKDFTKRVGNPSGKKILDAGSGNGGISIAFKMAEAQPVGIDIEKELYDISIDYSASFGLKIDFHLYEGFVMPFDDNSFDYAVSASVIEHTTDPVLYLQEIYRVLKPGGILYLGFPNKLWPKETHTGAYFVTYLPTFLRPIYLKVLKRNPLEENNLHFYSYFDLQRMLKKFPSGKQFSVVLEGGTSHNPVKKFLRALFRIFGISYKAFLPHILVLLRKE